jgi:catechol 2,3-dioxygenase-like lactoylglutathione lyase family enzyme
MPLEYTGVRVRNLPRSIRFFTEGLGLKVGPSGRMAAGGHWQELHDPETKMILELNYYPGDPPFRNGDELDHLGFRVTELDTVASRLVALGARLEIPPFEEGETRIAFLSDPDGLWIELYERRSSDEPPTSRPGS